MYMQVPGLLEPSVCAAERTLYHMHAEQLLAESNSACRCWVYCGPLESEEATLHRSLCFIPVTLTWNFEGQ